MEKNKSWIRSRAGLFPLLYFLRKHYGRASFFSAQMAVLRSFFSMFVVLGMYYFDTEMDIGVVHILCLQDRLFVNVYKVENVNGGAQGGEKKPKTFQRSLETTPKFKLWKGNSETLPIVQVHTL